VYTLEASHVREGIILAIAVNDKEQDRETPWGQGSVTPESLFHRHYRGLVGALAVACGSREMAADAVQDAFVELCKRWEKISRYEKPEAWLMHVAVNKLRSEQRSVRRRAAMTLRLQGSREEWTPAVPVALADAFRKLPPRQRLACALFYILDLPLEEVATVMGISSGAAGAHLHKARITLRPMLEEWS
jgi:RNA polymerase sigma-70 factor (ECF subfamily)